MNAYQSLFPPIVVAIFGIGQAGAAYAASGEAPSGMDDVKREKRHDIVALLRSETLDKRNVSTRKSSATAA